QLEAQLGSEMRSNDENDASPAAANSKPRSLQKFNHGILLQLYAEDPLLQLPQPGVIHEMGEQRLWELPGAKAEFEPSVRAKERVETDEGFIGQLLVSAQTREQTL